MEFNIDEIKLQIARLNAQRTKVGFTEVEIGVPILKKDVKLVEDLLEVKFPPDIVSFLTTFGTLNVCDNYCCGIYHSEILSDSDGTLYGETKKYRKKVGLKKDFIVIETAVISSPIVMDLTKTVDNIFYLDGYTDELYDHRSKSYFDFTINFLKSFEN